MAQWRHHSGFASVSIGRRELFELVWASPMARAGEELGGAARSVAGFCKAAGIPVPGRGHWRRGGTGNPQDLPELPDPSFCRPDFSLLAAPVTREVAIQFATSVGDLRDAFETRLRERGGGSPGARVIAPEPRTAIPHPRRRWLAEAVVDAIRMAGGILRAEPSDEGPIVIAIVAQTIVFEVGAIEARPAGRRNAGRWSGGRGEGLRIAELATPYARRARRMWQDRPGSPLELQIVDIATDLTIAAEIRCRDELARHAATWHPPSLRAG